MKCGTCRAEKRLIDKHGKERTPRGWKLFQGARYCADCWEKQFVLRSLVVAVSKPLDLSWDELTDRLEVAWRQTTQLSNAIVTKLAMLEPVRTPEMTRMPAAPNPYLYPWAREEFPDLDVQSINSVIQTVQRTYNRFRLEVFWRRSRSLPQYRYPAPAPFPSQSTKLEWLSDSQKVPVVTLRLGGERTRLQLQSKHQRNYREALSQIISGEAKICEGAIYRKVSHGTHRPGVVSRAPGGGQRFHSQVFVKLTAWLPRKPASGPAKRRHLRVSTGNDFFLAASVSGEPQWKLHADHVRRWINSHTERLRRLSSDQNFAARQSRRHRLPVNDFRSKLTGKHHRRMANFLKQTCAEVTDHAARNGCRKIIWQRENTGFLRSFPWFELETSLERRAEELGILFERATSRSPST